MILEGPVLQKGLFSRTDWYLKNFNIMEGKDTDIIIPIKIHEAERFGIDKFVVVDSIDPGPYFHRLYITIKDGKVYSYKTITIMNKSIFELGGTIYIKGHSLERDLVNGNEII